MPILESLTDKEKRAAREFMNREGFVFLVPESFHDDAASENVTNDAGVLGFIAECLERAAKSYRLRQREIS